MTKVVSRQENVVLYDNRTITVTKVLWRRRDNGREIWLTPEVRPLPSNFLHVWRKMRNPEMYSDHETEKDDEWELVVEEGI